MGLSYVVDASWYVSNNTFFPGLEVDSKSAKDEAVGKEGVDFVGESPK